MADPPKRETIIALGATHTAHRVASEIAFPKIRTRPVRTRCYSCMELIDPASADRSLAMVCPHCGAEVQVPEEVAAEVGSSALLPPTTVDSPARRSRSRYFWPTVMILVSLVLMALVVLIASTTFPAT